MADPEPPAKRVRTSTENGQGHDPAAREAGPASCGRRTRSTIARRRSRPTATPASPSPADDGRVLAITPRGQIVPFEARLARACDRHRRPRRHRSHRLRRRRRRCGLSRSTTPPIPSGCATTRAITALAFSPDGAVLAGTHAGRRLPLAPRRGSGPARARLRGRTRRRRPGARTAIGSPARWPTRASNSSSSPMARAAPSSAIRRPRARSPGAVPPTPSSPPAPTAPPPGRWPTRRWRTPPSVPCRPAAPAWSWSSAWRRIPARDLIAVGYANGQVGVMRLGQRDELLVRQDGGGAVTRTRLVGRWRASGAGHRRRARPPWSAFRPTCSSDQPKEIEHAGTADARGGEQGPVLPPDRRDRRRRWWPPTARTSRWVPWSWRRAGSPRTSSALAPRRRWSRLGSTDRRAGRLGLLRRGQPAHLVQHDLAAFQRDADQRLLGRGSLPRHPAPRSTRSAWPSISE